MVNPWYAIRVSWDILKYKTDVDIKEVIILVYNT